jgi:hypothetical protein
MKRLPFLFSVRILLPLSPFLSIDQKNPFTLVSLSMHLFGHLVQKFHRRMLLPSHYTIVISTVWFLLKCLLTGSILYLQ